MVNSEWEAQRDRQALRLQESKQGQESIPDKRWKIDPCPFPESIMPPLHACHRIFQRLQRTSVKS